MKIICVGRNYAKHAAELNNPLPKTPIFFLKPETALIKGNKPFFYPDFSNNIQYEVELVYRICRVGRHISEKFAHRYYNAIGIGIDFTARDIQQRCKQNGLPWEIAKAFDGAAPVSDFIALDNFANKEKIRFHLEKNGNTVQIGESEKMLFSADKIIAFVSQFVMLKTGDMIFTGTPSGTGKIEKGDVLKAYIEDELMLITKIC
jgi:2-keto-4-pentenoate hydratase/2-oxohepta-3-ene-1,7-dioic acid hydratase in catechol pathway